MKNAILFLLALVLLPAQFLLGAPTPRNPAMIHLEPGGSSWPVLRESFDSGRAASYLIHLDTGEVDTGLILFNVTRSPIFAYTDTIGTLSFTCKDSTGSDTLAIVAKWQGNPRPDGKGVWANIDSTELKDLGAAAAAANGVYTNKTALVVNTGAYSAFRFFLRNKLLANANRKSTCKDAVLIHRQRTR